MSAYEPVVGLEVHVQLKTASKLFCACPLEFGQEPNLNTCPVCLGLPGVLPVLNGRAVELAMRAALALNCRISEFFKFDRKNYFYPDLPKAYQISQYDLPLALDGFLEIQTNGHSRRIGIERVHMEEDAGKLVHAEPGHGVPPGTSFVDYNRVGAPLIEIVSRPEIAGPAEAHAYLDALKQIVRYIGVSDCDMEKGSLRCDANVSLRPAGSGKLGVKAELKNLNSFKFVEKALEVEIDRQAGVLESGGRVVQETRGYDAAKNITYSQRSKEEAHDYRYFPEPDLPGFAVSMQDIERARAALPELPAVRRARFEASYGLPAYDAAVLTAESATADYFEAVVRTGADAKKASNFIMTELLRDLKSAGLAADRSPVRPEHLADLLQIVASGEISGKISKDVFPIMFQTGKPPKEVIREHGLSLISDASSLAAPIAEVLKENPKAIEDFKSGKQAAIGFLVGQVMKKTRGQADPGLVAQELRKKIGQA
ncbi:MAG: glutaminyl-tRNA synthase (glutamine-hydrolyzing) subunit B [Candidatus Lindowbacteria bacterium RIFCSPLOWO2_12_FULL_62_27]|nr:MAG: glutaminyl-tRNA synthase (glutamine-hydrolyzing) subunit B [Candidatus Lindowbacteria bacterium RIFCSPLOWO2_12_FULL_62_27]OGH58759.1 MAG: glutaminyl-tRNA synthase (glutamine-hydrolyzing) subunit B [Candidatus Lindowbacteria bacterium RIFCSPLOWO2_02_FULL_62_12]